MTSVPEDEAMLRVELDDRGSGYMAFDLRMMGRLESMVLARYTEIYPTLQKDQQDELDWLEAQDNARTDMGIAVGGDNIEALLRTISRSAETRVEEESMLPAKRRLLELAIEAETKGKEIVELQRAVAAKEEKLPGRHRNGSLAILAAVMNKRPFFLPLPGDPLPEEKKEEHDAAEDLENINEDETKAEPAQVAESAGPSGLQKKPEEVAVAQKVDESPIIVNAVLKHTAEAIGQTLNMGTEEGLEEELLLAAKSKLVEVEHEIRKRAATVAVEAATKKNDIEVLHRVIAEAVEADVEEEPLSAARRKLAKLEMAVAVEGFDVELLLEAIDNAKKAKVDEEGIQVGKRRLLELEPAAYNKLIYDEVVEATGGKDVATLMRAIAAAVEVGVDESVLYDARRRLAELEMAVAAEGDDIEDLKEAMQVAEEAGVGEEPMIIARRRLAELELLEAIQGQSPSMLKNIEVLEAKLVVAVELQVPVEPLAVGRRKLAEMKLSLAIRSGEVATLSSALAEAVEAGVAERELKVGRKKLAELELRDAMQGDDIEDLRSAIENAAEKGVRKQDLEEPRRQLAKMDLVDATGREFKEPLREALAIAEKAGVEEELLVLGRRKLALLELKDATADSDVEVLKEKIAAGKAMSVEAEAVEKAKKKLKKLDADEYKDLVTEEMKEASQGEDREALTKAIEVAKKAGAEEEDELVPARRRLAELTISAAALPPDEGGIDDMEGLKKAIEMAKAEGLEAVEAAPVEIEAAEGADGAEEAPVAEAAVPATEGEAVAVEPRKGPWVLAIEAAEAKIAAIEADIVKAKARQKLLDATLDSDIGALQKAIKAAVEAGVEEEAINAAKKQLES